MSEPTMVKLRLDAPVDNVWHALTDEDELRGWFAEHANVRLPDTYEFWGRYTPDGAHPSQRLLQAEHNVLRFTWRISDTDTEVTIALEPEGDKSTILTLTQTNLPGFADMVSSVGELSVVFTFWSLSLANLADHLTGRDLTARCDYTSTDLRADMLIDASRHAVYESIADPEIFSRWFGVQTDVDRRVGGHWAMGAANVGPTATIVRLDDDAAMALEWPDGMVETWELADAAGGTKLTYVQSGFADANRLHGGWAGAVAGLAELRRYHELPDWHPMWLATHVTGTPEGITTSGN